MFGPGSLQGEPAVLDPEKRALIWRMYEVHPRGHPLAGNRVYDRCAVEIRKGTAKTELAAWVAFAELHPYGGVRFDGWDSAGDPVGRPVRAPYIPMMAAAEEQVQELAFGVLKWIVEHSKSVELFDISLERIVRLDAWGHNDGLVVPVSNSPATRDGARTTFQHFDEPLSVETLIPTVGGWLRMGDVGVGDMVYGSDGKPVEVVGVSGIHHGRRCYRVRFTDGASVVTDANHAWSVIDWKNRPRGQHVVTTQDMVDGGMDTGYGKRWRLPRSSGYDGVHCNDLPVDPYLAGLWLGDGATNAGYIHSSPDDYKHVVGDYRHTVSNDSRQVVIRWLPEGLRAALRGCGLLGDKHIHDVYRFASRAQRMELLAGLVDSDGYVIPGTGSVTFVQGRERLARGVYELVLSLGWDAAISWREDVRSRTGGMWRVQFFADEKLPTRLPRKAVPGVRKRQPRWPTIESIEPVDSVPVRCITVDNDDHLFVFGRESRLTHNSHRLILPRERAAHETMLQNLPKRQHESPWALYTSTAGQPGLNSVQEDVRHEAEAIAEGKAPNSSLFFFSRWAGDSHKELDTVEKRIAAIAEATGPVGEWGLGQFERIAKDYDRAGADRAYWERVYLNRWRKSGSSAFDMIKVRELATDQRIPKGALVAGGFDGARVRDATALVLTDISTGLQQIAGLWEKPEGADDWAVDEADVVGVFEEVFASFDVWRIYCDPPYWVETISSLEGRYPGQVVEWWMNRPRASAYSLRAYNEAIDSGAIQFGGAPHYRDALIRHLGHSGRKELKIADEQGVPLSILQKMDGRLQDKIDAAAAGQLSWQACLDGRKSGAKPRLTAGPPRRLY